MAQLAEMGEYDIRPQVIQAAEMAINANRQGQKLADVIAQQDLVSQDSIANQVLQLFANNTRSAKKIGEGLRRIAADVNAEASRSQEPDMFGEVPAKKPAAQVVEDAAKQIMIDAGQVNVPESAEREEGLKAPVAEEVPLQISPEQQKINALNKLEVNLSNIVPSFRAEKANGKVILKPRPLSRQQIALIKDLAGEAIDLGLPASILDKLSAAGTTRMNSTAAIVSERGWLLLGSAWSSSSRAEKLQAIVHELGHSVDLNIVSGREELKSDGDAWSKAHDQLKNWYDSNDITETHPLTYPFGKQYKGQVRLKEESFAQAFSFYFVSPVELQTNAPEAYSQIQSIVEGIQNESQRAGAAGATKTGAAGVKIQPSRTPEGTEVQSKVGDVGTDVSQAERIQDRDSQRINELQPVTKPADEWQ
jgi:hypothetical protein